jgi:hypothetical protein
MRLCIGAGPVHGSSQEQPKATSKESPWWASHAALKAAKESKGGGRGAGNKDGLFGPDGHGGVYTAEGYVHPLVNEGQPCKSLGRKRSRKHGKGARKRRQSHASGSGIVDLQDWCINDI